MVHGLRCLIVIDVEVRAPRNVASASISVSMRWYEVLQIDHHLVACCTGSKTRNR